MIDRDDVEQAIEIALGDGLSGEHFRHRSVSPDSIDKWRQRFRRIIAELPPDTSVAELLEALDE